MIFTIQETLLQIWENVKPMLSGITIGGIISTAFFAAQGALTRKLIGKIDYEKIVKDMHDSALNKIGDTTLNVDITPIVEKRMGVIKEELQKANEEKIKQLQDQLDKETKLLEWIGSVYKDSIAVSDEKKQELIEIINSNKPEVEPQIQITSIQGITKFDDPKPKEEHKPKTEKTEIIR